MIHKYKRECVFLFILGVLVFSTFAVIKIEFKNMKEVQKGNVQSYSNGKYNQANTEMAVTLPTTTTNVIPTTMVSIEDEIDLEETEEIEIIDDGSIIYDGLTLTELTEKLNKSLSSYLKNTGYYFAKYTKQTGIDPYLSVAIVLLETGCKWNCSYLTVKCNNIGGLKGGKSCNGGSYRKYDTLDEGIQGYLSIIYNNYFLKGMTTAETMASRYASSSQWANKVNKYIEEIRSK